MPARFSKRDFWNLGEIWDRNMWTKIFLSTKFPSKKSENFLVENFSGPKIFDFWSKNCSLKKSMQIQNFEMLKNFQNFDFFNEKMSIKNRKLLVPKNFRPKRFLIFFDEIFVDKNIFVHIFRSQISPRFQKSRLEKRAGIKKIRKGWPESLDKSGLFFPLFAAKPRPGATRFKNLLNSPLPSGNSPLPSGNSPLPSGNSPSRDVQLPAESQFSLASLGSRLFFGVVVSISASMDSEFHYMGWFFAACNFFSEKIPTFRQTKFSFHHNFLASQYFW